MIKTRPATPADESFLLSLTPRLADFPVPSWRTREEIARADHGILLETLHRGGGGTILIAEDATGERLGYAFASRKTDYFTGAPYAHIEVLAVLMEAEGKGVARALLAAVEASARTASYAAVTLNVFAANTRARGLYEHLGYEPELLRYRKSV